MPVPVPVRCRSAGVQNLLGYCLAGKGENPKVSGISRKQPALMSDGLRLECAHGAALTDAAVTQIVCTDENSTASTSASTTTTSNHCMRTHSNRISIAPDLTFLQDSQRTSSQRTSHDSLTMQEEQQDTLASLSANVHSRAGNYATRQRRRQHKKEQRQQRRQQRRHDRQQQEQRRLQRAAHQQDHQQVRQQQQQQEQQRQPCGG